MRTSTTQPPVGTPIDKSHPLAKGLVGCWMLNEGGGLKAFDSSGFCSIVGTLTNGAVFKQSIIGSSVIFDGVNDYIDLGNATALNFETTDQFSIATWMKPNVTGPSNIISKQQGGGPFAGYGLGTSSAGRPEAFLYNGSGCIVDFPSTYNDGYWHHLAFSYDGSKLAAGVFLYHNGLSVAKTIAVNNLAGSIRSTAAFQLNGRGGGNSPCNCSLSACMIYNRILQPSEVRQLYVNSYQMFQGKKK